ncbi:peptide ABC transporter ATP-binding protein [Halobacteriales archaeon QS_8_69_26]|nr:MAG: peptide ABC transporter ATP-binding protein [Halobacteriales archaeon QS_8_69_26]
MPTGSDRTADAGDDPLVSVRELTKYFYEHDSLYDRLLDRGPVSIQAVDGISFDIYEGETLGLVGESGCGKSTAGETLLNLQEATDGSVAFDGESIDGIDGSVPSSTADPPVGVKLSSVLLAVLGVVAVAGGGSVVTAAAEYPTWIVVLGGAWLLHGLASVGTAYGLWTVEAWGWRLATGVAVLAVALSLPTLSVAGGPAGVGVVAGLGLFVYLLVRRRVFITPSEFRRRTAIVFQDPFSSLDPRMTIGDVVRQPLDVHDVGTKEERRERVRYLIERVGLSADQLDRYPSEFSGGQRQRIAIARALALDPDFVVLDEPTSALDVSVQAQVLNLLDELQDEFGLTYLLISHDLSVIRHICDRVAVMYLGEIVELGDAEDLFESPRHPYTEVLLDNVPRAAMGERERDIETLNVDVPSPRDPPSGCRFRTRCPEVIPPEDVGLEQDQYRAVTDLRQRIEDREVSLRTARQQAEDRIVAQELADRLLEVDLPPNHRSYVDEALEVLAEGEYQDAADHLRERYESVCERYHPHLGDEDHPAACHLHGPLPEEAEEARPVVE